MNAAKEHGTIIRYYEDGSKKSETPYVDYKMHGTMILYNEDGYKIYEAVFENGSMMEGTPPTWTARSMAR